MSELSKWLIKDYQFFSLGKSAPFYKLYIFVKIIGQIFFFFPWGKKCWTQVGLCNANPSIFISTGLYRWATLFFFKTLFHRVVETSSILLLTRRKALHKEINFYTKKIKRLLIVVEEKPQPFLLVLKCHVFCFGLL